MKKRYFSEFKPRFSDFDMQGILNSRCYIDFLSEARIDQMVRCYGKPMDAYAKLNQTWVFSSVNINFLSPVYFGQSIAVETEVVEIQGSMATVEFVIKNPTRDRIHAKGVATYHLVDLATKRPIDISPEDRKIFLSSEK